MPMLIGNLFQQFYTMIDAVIVGKFVSVDALAAVGATNSVNFFMISLIIGLMSGISVVVAQYFGFKDFDRLKDVIATATYAVVFSAIILTVAGVLLAKPLLILLRTPANILDDSTIFLTTLFIGILPMSLYNGMAAILRALGNSITPLIFLILSSLMNIALDFFICRIYGYGRSRGCYCDSSFSNSCSNCRYLLCLSPRTIYADRARKIQAFHPTT